MTRESVRARIEEIGIIPAIRFSSQPDALFAAESVAACGIPIVEVTMTVPGAVEVIRELTSRDPEVVVGAGTVTDVETAHRCLDAGAAFLTSPGLDLEVVEFGLKSDTVVFPGAMTPSEIIAAGKTGADFVEVFPCSVLGGANYIRALKLPFPDIRLIAAGGVNQQTAADFIRAGAVAVGIGRELVPPDAVNRRQSDWICELAGRFKEMVREARSQASLT